MSGSGAISQAQWWRLFVTAVLHPERIKHQLVHELRKRQADEVSHCQLCDGGAAAGITELHTRNEVDVNRRCVGWRGAVQNLCQGRPSAAGRISREAMHGSPC